MAVDFTGKLFMLVSGRPGALDPQDFEIRFSKPARMSYSDLYEGLKQWTEQPEVSMWRRMLVLGPPPEFCLLSASQLDLPAEMSPETIRRERV